MNVDLTHIFKESRQFLNTWKTRYSAAEYPQKVVMNMFYRKYTIEKMWTTLLESKHNDWIEAYKNINKEYAKVSQYEIVPILERKLNSNEKVTTIQFTDFASYMQSAGTGDQNSIKGIEFTYLLHRILDELVLIWASIVCSGVSKIDAISKITGVVIEEIPINDYKTIEQIFDQLGAEKYLQTLLIKELQGTL